MDAGRVSIRPLGGISTIVVLGTLGCAWFARTDWPGSDFLRGEIVPFVRIVDAIGLGTLALLLLTFAVLGRQVRRLRRVLLHSQRVLEDIAEGVVVLDARQRIISASEPVGKLFGHAPAELRGRSLDVLLPGGIPELGKECVGQRKDGSDIHLELTVRAASEKAGPARTTLILRDITPSKRVHETLSTRESYLRLIVEQMPAILWTTDRELNITSTVGAGLAAVNLKSRELIGMSMLECLERERPECTPINAHLRAVCGESLSYEMEWKGRTFQVRVDPLRNAAKHITGTIGILVDVTDHKQAEEERARLVAILEATTDVVAMTGTDRRLLYLNRAGRKLLGIGLQEDVSAYRLTDLCAPARRPQLDESITQAIREGAWSGESALVSRAGVEIAVSQVVLAHKSRTGAFEYLSTIARDTTEHQRLEEQLRQAQKMEAVGRLAGGIAHDFNNLLCIITGYTALAADSLPPDEPACASLGEVSKAAERATALTRQLLAFSRKQMLVPQVLNLNTLLTNLEKMLRPLIGEDIELSLALGADLYPIKADHNQIEQVLMNLAVNARDAMPRGGRLTLTTTNITLGAAALRDLPEIAPGEYVCLEVRDTGCGMDREVLGHLFEPFFTTKGQGKGTGLGLATVFGIVKQSDGHIDVRSEPGQGTTFRIYLPRFRQVEAVESRASSGASAPRGGEETLLVVEDEDVLRSLASHTLRQRGYHILEACDGEEALEVSRRYPKPIHLLVSDVVMPRMGGSDLAARLLVERPDLKILFMSGFTDSALFRHGIVSGEVECLLKPFAPKDLAAKVREVLDRPTDARIAV